MKKKIKQSNNALPNTIKIGYTDYQFELWPDTFASTEKAQGEFFEEDEKIDAKLEADPTMPFTNSDTKIALLHLARACEGLLTVVSDDLHQTEISEDLGY